MGGRIRSRNVKTKSEILEEVLLNTRRLAIAHALLGLLSAAATWVRPGTFVPHLANGMIGYLAFEMIFNTASAWIPYVISWFFSKAALDARPPSATLTFIVAAILITILTTLFQVNAFALKAPPPTLILSVGTTIALLAVSGICAMLWQTDIGDGLDF